LNIIGHKRVSLDNDACLLCPHRAVTGEAVRKDHRQTTTLVACTRCSKSAAGLTSQRTGSAVPLASSMALAACEEMAS
jgi:hypothetical protein